MSQEEIIVRGARENNLKNLTIALPKKKIIVFTGLSGSGKSSLVFDTIAAESQRQLNETFNTFIRHRLPHYGQPEADAFENLTAAIIIDQKALGGGSRSTVGTATEISNLLRLLFSRIGTPFVGYSNVFSFNHPEGMCPACRGLGTVAKLDEEALLDLDKSLNEGAFRFRPFGVGTWVWKRYVWSGLFDNDKKLKRYTPEEMKLLLYQTPMKPKKPQREWGKTMEYEGVVYRFKRAYLEKDEAELKAREKADLHGFVQRGSCPACHGARLNPKILSCKILGKNIAAYSALQITDLISAIQKIKDPSAVTVIEAIQERLEHLRMIGLDYVSLNRETSTLSGGESQRIKMVRHLGSSLSDMTYIFDEPSVGLHAKDVAQLNNLMRNLRDKGNTILIVEHDPEMIAIADQVIDMGPGAGAEGGQIVYQGSIEGLKVSGSMTGTFLRQVPTIKSITRSPQGFLKIKNARHNNLKNVSVDIPCQVMTVVSGVAGSGKSSLINTVLRKKYPDISFIDQSALRGSKRSNVATYVGIFDQIRSLFAKAHGVSVHLFSFNSEGACKECKGLGAVELDLAFMNPIITPCEACQGQRYSPEVLKYSLRGKNISAVLKMSVREAAGFFKEPAIQRALQRLADVGIEYLSLGQSLDTLSGGERQRMKLATELERNAQTYVFDEPTSGLHLSDVKKLIGLLNKMVDEGKTVIVIEHNLDFIAQADWVIDLGPGAGKSGGQILYEGTVKGMLHDASSITGKYLKNYLESFREGKSAFN